MPGKNTLTRQQWMEIRFVMACLMRGFTFAQIQTATEYLGNETLMKRNSEAYYAGWADLFALPGPVSNLREFGFEPTGEAITISRDTAVRTFWAVREICRLRWNQTTMSFLTAEPDTRDDLTAYYEFEVQNALASCSNLGGTVTNLVRVTSDFLCLDQSYSLERVWPEPQTA